MIIFVYAGKGHFILFYLWENYICLFYFNYILKKYHIISKIFGFF